MLDQRQYSPSTARNAAPILSVMQRVFPQQGKVLEIASGSGEHAVFAAQAMPGLLWQPSDPEPQARASIASWIEAENLPNILPPLAIDVRAPNWNIEGPADVTIDVIVAINMIHIAPWDAALGLFEGAARLLPAGGVLFLYGPYKREGRHTAPSNESFDHWLKARDPSFGVRDLEDVVEIAGHDGLTLREIVEMPANNLSLVFEKIAETA